MSNAVSTFQSYQSYNGGEPSPEPTSTYNPARIIGAAVSVSMTDGVITESRKENEHGRVSDINPHSGTESIMATAVHPKGLPVYAIEDTTLITVNGLQAPAAFWAKEGLLTKGPDGTYQDASAANKQAPQAAPEAAPSDDVVPMHQDHAAVLQRALGDMPESHAMAIAAAGIGAACGKLDPMAAMAKFAQVTGQSDEAGMQRFEAMQAVFQAQADGVLTHKFGISAADLPGFYDYCRTHKQGQMQDAIGRQVHGNDMAGWRALATKWLASTPPSAAALKAAGVPVRKSSHKQGGIEIFIGKAGVGWLSPEAAARAGYL